MDVYERVSQEYDEAYYKAQKLIDRHNPCKITLHECGGVTCAIKDVPGQICCVRCKHHSYDGCTVRCLACKLSLCPGIEEHYEDLRAKLNKIRHIILYPGYTLLVRESKEDAMRCIRTYKKCKHYSSILCIRCITTDIIGHPCSSSDYLKDCELADSDVSEETLQQRRVIVSGGI